MGKPKKGKKGQDDFGDDVDIDPLASTKDGEVGGTNKVNKKDDDLDDAADEIAAHSLEMNKGSIQEEEEGASQIAPRKKEKKKKKKQLDDEDEIDVGVAPVEAGIDRFQMLAMMEDDDVGQKESEDEDASRKDDEIVLESVGDPDAQSKSKKKKKKVKEKVKTAEEEDVEAILAALDEAGSKKKGKKAKKKEASEECLEEEIKGPVPTPEAEKSEPKVVTIDYDSEEDTKKKKKKGKKGEQAAEIKLQKVEPKVVTIDDYESEEEMKKKKKKGKNDDDEIMAKLESMGPKVVTMDDYESEEDTKKAKKKKGKKEKDVEKEGDDEADEDQEEGGTVKTAAQKKKEKKERERQKKLQQKQKQHPAKKEAEIPSDEGSKAASIERELTPQASEDAGTKATADEDGTHEDDGEKESKKKKKKKGEKEEKPKVVNKKLAAIKEHLAKLKEEEEKRKQEEEEEERREQERIQKLEEQKRLEEERRLKKKMKKKEREERAKQEGRFLTEKQKQDRLRLNQMLQLGGGIVTKNDSATNKEDVPKKKPIYTKKKKDITPKSDEAEKSPSPIEERSISIEEAEPVEQSKVEVEVAEEEEEAETGEVKESWDAESEDENEDDEEEENEEKEAKVAAVTAAPVESEIKSEPQTKMEVQVEELSEEEEQEEESESEEESTEESDDERTPAERGRDKVMKLHEAAEKKRTTDVLRAPVVCVLGHVDTGKTKILDKLRRTNVQDGEAGGITQQIGATNVPKDAILEKTKMCKEFMKQELKLPGLLIIDTPGHESFSNLRSRGSSLCDIAVLVVDIMHGLEPQTIESINLLKQRKTPFVIALNKIDRLYQWKSNPLADVANTIKRQTPHTKAEFDERARAVILQMAEEGLNSTLYYENKNPKEYVSMVPTSAHSGDGMGNLVALICELTQTLLAKRLAYSEELHATVMEVKALPGLGTTIDVILVNGKICEGDTMVLAGTEGPIITPIRGLLMPQPMKELRVKNQYEHFKEVMAAQGVKIIAKDLEKSLAGLPLYVAHDDDEIEYYKQEVEKALEDALKSIRLSDRGVFVQASTLGSLEALLEFLRTSKIKYAGINIGPVHKKDIMKASIMLEHEPQYAVILAFDVKVEREAQELADHLGVTIFTADIIYHLFDKFTAYRTDLMRKKQEEFRHLAVFPCKLRILPQYIFNSRDPIVVGVVIEAGFLKEGTPLCVPSKEFVDIGRVSSIEFNHKQLEVAKQGQEVCIKINPTPGEAPKMFGRHFEATDMLVSKISRDSIDAVKDYFRDEMSKSDWKLIMELKRLFQIL